jgi:predicted CoA-substrate-specific enzyme activase
MRVAGIDIGSRTVKAVLVEDGRLIGRHVLPNSHDPVETCRAVLRGLDYERIVATGYGRHLFRRDWDCEVVTEIRAAALGARFIRPSARILLDIGGQDTKAIALDGDGNVRKFEMNDRCAAGTGRFLEVMAGALACSMPDFIRAAQAAERSQKINSMCTVFAESEVISMVARGIAREELALGIHEAIAARAAGLLSRLPIVDELFFCGGVAWNPCITRLIGERLGRPVRVPEEPQALGCALHGSG